MADLIATIGEHCVPFGGYFTFDTIKGLFVYFDQFDIHDISFEIVREVSLRECGCHNVSLVGFKCPLKGFELMARVFRHLTPQKPPAVNWGLVWFGVILIRNRQTSLRRWSFRLGNGLAPVQGSNPF